MNDVQIVLNSDLANLYGEAQRVRRELLKERIVARRNLVVVEVFIEVIETSTAEDARESVE